MSFAVGREEGANLDGRLVAMGATTSSKPSSLLHIQAFVNHKYFNEFLKIFKSLDS